MNDPDDKLQVVMHNEDLQRLVLYDPNNQSLIVREDNNESLRLKSRQLLQQQQIEDANNVYSPIIPSPTLRNQPLLPISRLNNSGNTPTQLNHNHNTSGTLQSLSPQHQVLPPATTTTNTGAPGCCPLCKRSFTPGSPPGLSKMNSNGSLDLAPFNSSPYYRSPITTQPYISRDYFLLLGSAANNENNNNGNADQHQTSPPVGGLGSEFLNIGYYKKFFKEDVKIGSGGFGSVYLCRHLINGVDLGEFAVKKVPVGDNIPWLFRVLKEVKALETLTKHRNIINYKHSWLEYDQPADFGPKVPCLYILMEYANYGNLHDYMNEKRETMPENEIWSFFIDLCHGIGYLHHSGIIHRDLKPPNILIHQSYDSISDKQVTHLMISDFGTCDTISPKAFKDNLMKRTGNTGTTEYIAPELLQKNERGEFSVDYDEKCDVWSLGILLYQMAYGTLPYKYSGNPFADEDPNRSIPDLVEEIAQFNNTRLVFPQSPPRSRDLKDMITILLRAAPHDRPTISQILSTQFMQTKTKYFTLHPIHIVSTGTRKSKHTHHSKIRTKKSSDSDHTRISPIRRTLVKEEDDDIGGDIVATTAIVNNVIDDDDGSANSDSLISSSSESSSSEDDNDDHSFKTTNKNKSNIEKKNRTSPTYGLQHRTKRSISTSNNIATSRKLLPLDAPRSGRFRRAANVIQRNVGSSSVHQAFYMLLAFFQIWLCFDQCSTHPNSYPSATLLYPLLLLSLIPILVSNQLQLNNQNNILQQQQQMQSQPQSILNNASSAALLCTANNRKFIKKVNTTISIIRFIYYVIISLLLPKEVSCKSTSPEGLASILPPIADYVVFPLISLFKNLTLLIINLIFIYYRD
ncbi:hypothetical protein DICPUDRAFT_147000 [Dictyostelium purpureum]|uniref:non-specific serine/threonine protein kinase n=1 Tax=Dictyostelium purpureum TaxID=5786 RepID=F0Z7E5_DICPU|nr:uncharacterized protein DICPUDRAFT_147000 [Dictyostelium purpureum]EGC40163.1 hypothetical protein DICPUDRAFT_147000 [Dictyostelium purpureum]|eukprot:XP_003283353.1 hypothetical protein DICPUDRAFT_147000 [Dictyostelium purpureum]